MTRSKYDCPNFLEFLATSVKTKQGIDELQQFFGYCLQRRAQLNVFLLLVSPGGSGKTVLTALLREMIGPDKCSSLPVEDFGNIFETGVLEGKWANFSKVSFVRSLISAEFKSALAEECVLARDKNGHVYSFRPHCKFIVESNHLPADLEEALDFQRRALVVRFGFVADQDRDLLSKLLPEIEGIRNWARQGLNRMVMNQGGTCNPPKAGQKADISFLGEPAFLYERDYSIEGAV